MDDGKTLSGPETLKNYRQLHREREILSDVVTQLVLEVGPLEDAETCLSVGTGCGEYDIIFAKHFLPNLKKFIAVEKDRSCVEELKRNLKSSFGNDLQVEIHEMLIEDFQKGFSENNVINKKVDVVLCFHALYSMTENDRMKFFESCINSWLKPETGRIVVLSRFEGDDMARLYKKFEKPIIIKESLYGAMRSYGWKYKFGTCYELKIDASDPRKNYENMFMFNHVTEEVFIKTIEEVACDGVLLQRCILSVFGKDVNY